MVAIGWSVSLKRETPGKITCYLTTRSQLAPSRGNGSSTRFFCRPSKHWSAPGKRRGCVMPIGRRHTGYCSCTPAPPHHIPKFALFFSRSPVPAFPHARDGRHVGMHCYAAGRKLKQIHKTHRPGVWSAHPSRVQSSPSASHRPTKNVA